MPENTLIHVPFILDYAHLKFDQVIIFIVTIMLTITVNAEGQAFMATVLGDSRKDDGNRFHFNPIFHIHPLGLACFAVAGFGWPRPIDINAQRFRFPKVYRLLVKCGGAFANFLLACIAGSISFILTRYGVADQVFSLVVAVNIMVFVFNILPVPPLAGASIIGLIIPEKIKNKKTATYFSIAVSSVFVAVLALMRINDMSFFSTTLNPIVRKIFVFMLG